MITPGISQVMGRVSAIQGMVGRAADSFSGDTFAGALGTAMGAGPAPVAERPVGSAPLDEATPSRPDPGMPPEAARWSGAIDRAARDAGIDPALLTAVVWVESGFRQDAVSHAGAIGLAQLMPGTAELMDVDPYDPEQNLAGGARFLAAMVEKFGRVDLALAAYNAGPARVSSLHDGGPGVPVSESYVEAVLDRHRILGGAT